MFTNKDDKVYLEDTAKTLIEIWEGGNGGPENPVRLDKSTRKYIHVNLKQVTYYYDTG